MTLKLLLYVSAESYKSIKTQLFSFFLCFIYTLVCERTISTFSLLSNLPSIFSWFVRWHKTNYKVFRALDSLWDEWLKEHILLSEHIPVDLSNDSCGYLTVLLKQNYLSSAWVCSQSSSLLHGPWPLLFIKTAVHYLQTGNNWRSTVLQNRESPIKTLTLNYKWVFHLVCHVTLRNVIWWRCI